MYGKDNFVRETLFTYYTEKEAYNKEAEIVTFDFIKLENVYNLVPGGKGGWDRINLSPLLEIYKEKAKQTMVERYGVDHAFKEESAIIKRINAIFEKYGVSHIMQVPEIAERAQKSREISNTKKYGVSAYTSTDEFKQKTSTVLLEKYNVTNIMQVPEIAQKAKENCIKTNIKRYGKTSWFQSDECLKRAKESALNKYGVDHISKAPHIKSEFTKTINKLWENAKIIQCPHCEVSSKNWSNMKRYHFDKCKNK